MKRWLSAEHLRQSTNNLHHKNKHDPLRKERFRHKYLHHRCAVSNLPLALLVHSLRSLLNELREANNGLRYVLRTSVTLSKNDEEANFSLRYAWNGIRYFAFPVWYFLIVITELLNTLGY